ncbi:MAG: hypothetical protein WBO46_13935 [Caldilineaceae bacterium]
MPPETCLHKNLVLLTEAKDRVRCRHCHLTIRSEQLSGFCPECYETSGQKRNDFDAVEIQGNGKVQYECDDCGVRISVP